MEKNRFYKFIYDSVCRFIWIFVPVLSFRVLSEPILTVRMGRGIATAAAMPEKEYNGFQLLIHGNLVNGYNHTVMGMSFVFLLLKIMIAVQIIFDVILVGISIWEWTKELTEETTKLFLRVRGGISIGYVLTAFSLCKLLPLLADDRNLLTNEYGTYAWFSQYSLEGYFLFSIGVVILFILTLLPDKKKEIESVLYYLCWLIYPLFLLSTHFLLPMLWKVVSGCVGHTADAYYSWELYQLIEMKFTHLSLVLLVYTGIAMSVLLLALWFFEVGHAIRCKTFQAVPSKYGRIWGGIVWGYFICTTLICCLLRLFHEDLESRGGGYGGATIYVHHDAGSWYTVGMYLAIILVAWYLFFYPSEDSDRNRTICRILLGAGALVYVLKNITYGYIGRELLEMFPVHHRYMKYTFLTYIDNVCFFGVLLTFWFRPYSYRGKREGLVWRCFFWGLS